MSEYRWYVKKIWVGVEGPEPDLKMLGVIQRSGWCYQTGHFCHVKVNVNGKKIWAGGAEDRIFYFHYVDWKDLGGSTPRDMVPALGWCKGENLYAFAYKGQVVATGRDETGRSVFLTVERELWQDGWEAQLKLRDSAIDRLTIPILEPEAKPA